MLGINPLVTAVGDGLAGIVQRHAIGHLQEAFTAGGLAQVDPALGQADGARGADDGRLRHIGWRRCGLGRGSGGGIARSVSESIAVAAHIAPDAVVYHVYPLVARAGQGKAVEGQDGVDGDLRHALAAGRAPQINVILVQFDISGQLSGGLGGGHASRGRAGHAGACQIGGFLRRGHHAHHIGAHIARVFPVGEGGRALRLHLVPQIIVDRGLAQALERPARGQPVDIIGGAGLRAEHHVAERGVHILGG